MSTEEQLRAQVLDALRRVAPDRDLAALGDETALRSELELDSLDFLAFVEGLSKATGVRIEESDYEQLRSLRQCVEFLRRP
jgi:acyl carrier protein